ncbi:hypothetical protein FHX57_007718 [Paraburkholderia tropica]|nr:hypothetical protein [Paraburkholderia tropica]
MLGVGCWDWQCHWQQHGAGMIYVPDDDPTALPEPRYVEWEPDTTLAVVPTHVLKSAGWKRVTRPVYRVVAGSYLDLQTGEIIKKRAMFQRRLPVPRNAGVQVLEQLGTVRALGKRSRELCEFLLRMRNGRGGFMRPLPDLVDDYIHRNGTVQRAARARTAHAVFISDISRAGILVNMQTLGSAFQKHGDRSPKKVLEEAAPWYGWPGIFRGKSGFSSARPGELYITSKTAGSPVL